MVFINRKKELGFFKNRLDKSQPEFIVVYGRRRVGKTETILQAFKNQPDFIYLLANSSTSKKQLEEFSRIIGKALKQELLLSNPFNNWRDFWMYLAKQSQKQRIVVVIDEFPNLIKIEPSIVNILQGIWDLKFQKETRIFLILCGSSMSMMEKEVLGYKSPVYGRRTGQLKFNSLDFFNVQKFFPKYSTQKQIEAYAVLGGIPAYLRQFDGNLTLEENIKKNILTQGSFLSQETAFILREELSEPRYYFSILESVALGKTKLSDIINDTGLAKGHVSKYLAVLQDLGFVERIVPVTQKHPHKSRLGLYKLKDNFFRFWFRFLHPYLDEFERQDINSLFGRINKQFPQFVSLVFEEVSQEWLWRLNSQKKLLFKFEKIGKWWHKAEEIDLVAFNKETDQILFGEVKWQNRLIGFKELADLKIKSKLVKWGTKNRKEHFLLASKSGFEKSLKQTAKKEKIILMDLKNLK